MFSSKFKDENLLKKLYNRQLWGQFTKGISSDYEPAKQLFKKVPDRLIFPLSNTIPNIGNHILMGASKCGKFLLTYTFTLDSINELLPSYRYRLHFWSFVPGRQATKVAEVQLFDNTEISEILSIVMLQWNNVGNRLVVFGHSSNDVEVEEEEGDEYCKVYVTVTTIPNSCCKDCRTIAASFDEEEMAANWNSCVGLSCGRHGLTFHTWFSLPSPSQFDPKIACASDSKIVVNTGSFIYVVEFNTCEAAPDPVSVNNSSLHSNHHNSSLHQTLSPTTSQSIKISNSPIVNRLSYRFLRDSSYMILVTDSWANKIISLLIKWIDLGNQIDIKELPFYLKIALQKHYEMTLINKKTTLVNLSSQVNQVLNQIYSRYLQPRPKWFSSDKTNRLSSYTIKKQAKDGPDKVYDFDEEDRIESCTKFEAFRRHCLANKVYEFRSDEERNVENIRPGVKFKHRLTRRQLNLMNDCTYDEDDDISRFMGGLGRDVKYRRRKIKYISDKYSTSTTCPANTTSDLNSFHLSDEVGKAMLYGFGHQPVPKCSARYKRIYIETDRETQSSVTDLDDDEIGIGFPCHLPISVYGASYTQMQRISNHRADRLNVWSAEVIQSSLDIEGICHVAAESVCTAEHFKFNYFVDYDTQIIQVCPSSCDILINLFIRLSADNLKVKDSNINKTDHSASQTQDNNGRNKNLYDCQVLIIWSPVSRICFLEGYSCLAECSNVNYNCKASVEANRLRHIIKSTFGFGKPNLRTLEHQASGEQLVSCSLIVDNDNLIGFKKVKGYNDTSHLYPYYGSSLQL